MVSPRNSSAAKGRSVVSREPSFSKKVVLDDEEVDAVLNVRSSAEDSGSSTRNRPAAPGRRWRSRRAGAEPQGRQLVDRPGGLPGVARLDQLVRATVHDGGRCIPCQCRWWPRRPRAGDVDHRRRRLRAASGRGRSCSGPRSLSRCQAAARSGCCKEGRRPCLSSSTPLQQGRDSQLVLEGEPSSGADACPHDAPYSTARPSQTVPWRRSRAGWPRHPQGRAAESRHGDRDPRSVLAVAHDVGPTPVRCPRRGDYDLDDPFPVFAEARGLGPGSW